MSEEDIVLTEVFQRQYEPLGFPSELARKTVVNSSARQDIEFEGLRLSIFLCAGLRDDAISIVIAHPVQGHLEVYEAVWLPSSLVTAPLLEEPLYLLRVFAEQYGVRVAFNGQISRFHYHQYAVAPSGIIPWSVVGSPNTNVAFLARCRETPIDAGSRRIEVLFFFMLDTDAYRRAVNGSMQGVVRRSIDPTAPAEPTSATVAPAMSDAVGDLIRHLQEQLTSRQLARLRSTDAMHPLVRRVEALERLRSAFLTPGNVPTLGDIAVYGSVLIDATTWAQTALTGPIWDFIPDDAVRERLRTVVMRPDGYEDTISELYVWSALRERGLTNKVRQEGGLSDLDIYFRGPARIPGEVKSMRATTNPENLGNHLRKANTQLKRSPGDGHGIVFLRILHSDQTLAELTSLPPAVSEFQAVLRAALRNNSYSGIDAVVMVWEQFSLYHPPSGTQLVFRRTSRLFDRQRNEHVRENSDLLQIGQAITMPLTAEGVARLL
ncbi:MAG TPA: hypothetical protein VHS78_01075 [Candidatus Elarobacter sp.]|nr:hypothetical protein [Candidatus Elarobacter sp.]